MIGPLRKFTDEEAKPKKRTYPETKAQIECVKWLRARGDCLVIRCENGEERTPQATERAKAMGLEPGATDLIVICHLRVLFVEMKAAGGNVSEKQKEIHRIIRNAGHDVYVCKGFGDNQRKELGALIDGHSRR